MREVSFLDKNFIVFREVYEPSDDSFMLAEAIKSVASGDFELSLDVGCGCGILTLFLSEKSRFVVAVDVNPIAARNAELNVSRGGVKHKVQVLVGNLLSPFKSKPIFDLIVFNPPYLPEDEYDSLVSEKVKAAWSGGRDGRRVIDAFLSTFHQVLKPGGILMLVQSSLSNCDLTLRRLEDLGFEVEVVSVKHFFYESLYVIKAVKR
ncbi:MAG: methyltransferase [Candidatus Methanomethylicota archaeon]|uniref:Methyltransferase n=1 Tax=Thermoproteota archaeon TaxID=2056631 RepID=A0A497EZE1_9CREN|nr:MAG: methyltransferase [Candidatus Verstraetearchaeota archaeon]